MPPEAVRLWWLSIGIGAAVIIVVAILLLAIIATARSIDRHAREIWEVGKKIAANTVSIWMLQQTNRVAGEILQTAKSIDQAARSLPPKLDALGRTLQKGGSR